MVAHEGPCVDPPLGARAGFAHARKEESPVIVVAAGGPPAVSAHHDMVEGARVFHADAARPAGRLQKSGLFVNICRLTPSFHDP